MLALGACGSGDEGIGTVGFVEGFFGAVVSDEPRSALVGRDVLSAGGSAADAVVAMAFAATVTMPSSAGLGGGGACIGFDAETLQVSSVDFAARPPARVPPSSDRPSAVPGFTRGLFAFHARFGRLSWPQLLGPAEQLARFGFRVSRAFARDLRSLDRALLAEPTVRAVFSSESGDRLVEEGELLRQVELAAVISRIRTESAGAFYSGAFAQQLVEATTSAGGSLTLADLTDYRPVILSTIEVPFGDHVAHFAAPPAAGGAVAAQIWALLEDDFDGESPTDQLALLAAAGQATDSDRDTWMQESGDSSVPAQELVASSRLSSLMTGGRPSNLTSGLKQRVENAAAATFIAVDRDGSAATCSVTLNGPFGTGRIAPGTGIMLAAAPGPNGRGATALTQMMVVNQNVGEFYFVGAASGGTAAPTALASVALRVLVDDEPLGQAIAATRVLGTRAADRVFFEAQGSGLGRQALASVGGRAVEVPSLGRVNAIACTRGIPPYPETCAEAADPRGAGLSVSAD